MRKFGGAVGCRVPVGESGRQAFASGEGFESVPVLQGGFHPAASPFAENAAGKTQGRLFEGKV